MMTNRCCIADTGTIWGLFKKNKFHAVQVARKMDLMKWSSMNNTDILAHVELAYKPRFAKSPLPGFDYEKELYLGEKKVFRLRCNYIKEMHAHHIWI